MRLAEIAQARTRLSGAIQPLPGGDYSGSVGKQFALRPHESAKRRIKRLLAPAALRVLQPWIRRQLGFTLPFRADLMSYGERFADDAALSFLLGRLPRMASLRVLIPGCYMGDEDVQFWLRRGVRQLEGIDVYSFDQSWRPILQSLQDQWRIPVSFRQASIESIPFAAGSFDLIVSYAVLEHVRNLRALVDETTRVLSPGGYALHSFGPLYYSYGADHCIAAHGMNAGYDHLLLEQADYLRRIGDRSFFEKATGNADLAFWAVQEQFSFATAAEYLECFQQKFELCHVIAKISSEGLLFRRDYPDIWQRLLTAGIAGPDLLVKSLVVVLRKLANGSRH